MWAVSSLVKALLVASQEVRSSIAFLILLVFNDAFDSSRSTASNNSVLNEMWIDRQPLSCYSR
jgi:hypothetical protein